ncbi:MAG: hypothetical protein GY739_19230 [Mesoflavibacter sp.]|nr:hypothetical protein [Mesoflavibacter sp.]
MNSKQEKALSVTSTIASTILGKLQLKNINADLASLAYYNIEKKQFLHGSSCKSWNKAIFDMDVLNNNEGLASVICDKYAMTSDTGWEDIARPYFKSDPDVNENYPDVVKFVKVRSGYIGVCLKATSINCSDEKTIHQLCYEGLHMLKSIDQSRIEDALIPINDNSFAKLKANHDSDVQLLREKEKRFNAFYNLSSLPSYYVDGIKITSKEMLIIYSLTECWDTAKRESYNIDRNDVANLKIKVKKIFNKEFDEFIRFLKFRNIL